MYMLENMCSELIVDEISFWSRVKLQVYMQPVKVYTSNGVSKYYTAQHGATKCVMCIVFTGCHGTVEIKVVEFYRYIS